MHWWSDETQSSRWTLSVVNDVAGDGGVMHLFYNRALLMSGSAVMGVPGFSP